MWGPLGLARLVDARGQGNAIAASFVEDHWSVGVSRMLFRTFDHFPADHWPKHFTVVSEYIQISAIFVAVALLLLVVGALLSVLWFGRVL